ncbi:MAG: TlpA disulfide reductase family protein, partial [Bryobacteraceae bacterium]
MSRRFHTRGACGVVFAAAGWCVLLGAQQNQIVWSDREKPIGEQVRHLRDLPDAKRALVTKELAVEIRQLAVTSNKLNLAIQLASLSTEADFGRDTLQEVATTLADSLCEHSLPDDGNQPPMPYIELAQLARYEHVKVEMNAPQFTAAMSKLEAADRIRQDVNFTLKDLHGQPWTLKGLRGKVVLVNFSATWCPPCRKEIPDLEALYQRFQDTGLIVLAISDENTKKVEPFVADHKMTYPVLLDPGRKVNTL